MRLKKLFVALTILGFALTPEAIAQIPFGAPATSTILNKTFGAKAYTNTWTGINTFSGSLLAPTVSLSDSSLNVATTDFVKGQNYLTTAPVTSVFGRTGIVTATSGDYTTALVSEATNLYFTNARAIASVLTGYVSGAGTVSASDSILQGIQKLNGNTAANTTAIAGKENSITSGTTGQYWRGDKTFQILDKTTVGLANVDNTSDASKPISTATNAALALKAPLASPTFTGTVTISGTQALDGDLVLNQVVDAVSAGANIALTLSKPTVVLTNASLTSIGSIASPVAGKTVVIMNKTGVALSVLNEYASATAANRIITGTSANLSLAINGSLWLSYQANDSRWHVIGGSGGGGASGVDYNGSTQYIDTGTTIQLTTAGFQAYQVSGNVAPTSKTTLFIDALGGTNFVQGTTITLIGVSDSLTLTLLNSATSNGFNLNGDAELKRGDTITLMYAGYNSQFHEISRSIK